MDNNASHVDTSLPRWAQRAHGDGAIRRPQMRPRPSEQTLPDEGLAQEQLNVLLGPLPRWQRL